MKSNDSGLETGERKIFLATSQLSLYDFTHVCVERCSIHIWSVLCQSKPIYKYHEKCSKNLSGNSQLSLRIPQKISKYPKIFLKISFYLNVFSSKSSKNSPQISLCAKNPKYNRAFCVLAYVSMIDAIFDHSYIIALKDFLVYILISISLIVKEKLRRSGTLKIFHLPSNYHHMISRTGGLNIVSPYL